MDVVAYWTGVTTPPEQERDKVPRHLADCGKFSLSIYLFINIYLFIWLCWVLVVAHGIFSWDMWDHF